MKLNRLLLTRTRWQLMVLSALLMLAITASDFFSGFELSFSIFYLAPIALVGWYVGRREGLFACVLGAVLWFLADHASGHTYSHPVFPFWNAFVRFGFFTIVTWLLVNLRQALQKQQNLAERDGLTGLWNGRTFTQYCQLALSGAARKHQSICLAYIDIDGFKGINDTLGHSAGDQILKAVAYAMTSSVRATDLVARLGGDEFAILAPATSAPEANEVFARLHQKLGELAAKHQWPIGFSIGVAVFETPPATPDEAIRAADRLMYKIKHSVKNQVLIEMQLPPSAAAGPGHPSPASVGPGHVTSDA